MAVIILSPLRLLPYRIAGMAGRPQVRTESTTAGRGRTSDANTGSNADGSGSIGTAKMLSLGLPRIFLPLPLGLPRRLRLTCDDKTS